MAKRLLPLASMEKILRKAGAERVSDESKIILKDIMEDIAEDISTTAIQLASHAGRKTIKAGDIKLASK